MAVSFKKEVILEAIKSVLAEEKAFVKNKKGDEALVDVDPTDSSVKNDPNISSIVTTSGRKIKEDHHENPNDESDMAKVQLHNTAKYCIELLRMIQDGQQLDAWVQDKLSVAFEYIDTVKHYLEGEEYLASTEAPSEEEPLMEDEDVYDTDLDDKKPSNKDLKKEKGFVAQSAADQAKAARKKKLTPVLDALEKRGVISRVDGKLKINDMDAYKKAIAAINEVLLEGVSCCGRCGRVHESSQECKKPYISKDSPKHCSNKK